MNFGGNVLYATVPLRTSATAQAGNPPSAGPLCGRL
jgi:hypothetical protein